MIQRIVMIYGYKKDNMLKMMKDKIESIDWKEEEIRENVEMIIEVDYMSNLINAIRRNTNDMYDIFLLIPEFVKKIKMRVLWNNKSKLDYKKIVEEINDFLQKYKYTFIFE